MVETTSLVPAEVKFELSPQDKEKITQIQSQIDLSDGNSILQYGVGIQGKISNFADSVLTEVRAKDAGFAGDMLTNLLANVKSVDVDGLAEGASSVLSSIPLIGGLFDKFKRFIGEYQKISAQIEKLTEQLDDARMTLIRDNTMLDGLFQKNVDYFRELEFYVHAAEEKIKECHDKILPEFKAKAEASTDPIEVQKYKDMAQAVNRFEKRAHDMKLTRMVSLQTLPQIRLVQASNQELAEKIQSSILNTIPLWKNQIVIAISLFRQKKALELQKEVSDATNELLKKNAELLKEGTTEIAKESERGIVDIETLKKVNEDLISTIENVISIQKEGREKRAEVEKELVKIEGELKQKLMSVKE